MRTEKCWNCDTEFTDEEKHIVDIVICCKCSGVDVKKLRQQDKDEGYD